MSRPQLICGQEDCQAVALTGRRYCKHHTAQRGRERVQRANAIRHEPWLPENRSLIGVVDLPGINSAAGIIASAESIIRALDKKQIDRRRASVFYYAAQISYSALRLSSPKDPELRTAGRTLYDLALTLGGTPNN